MSNNNTALLLLDLQNEMVDPAGKIGSGGLAKVVEERGVIKAAGRAVAWARAHEIPVVFVRLGFREDYADALSVAPRIAKIKEHGAAVLGTWGTEFPKDLTPNPADLVVTKQCVNAFYNTGLLNWLHARGIRHILIGGVVTNLAVESAARAADDAGLAVTVVEDLCASPNSDWHRFSFENILPMFATITTTEELIA
jgi:nicotinamidase-related amidase